MFGSQILETVIGVIFIYFLFCIICTAVREGIEALLKTRAAYLEQGIRELLYDKTLHKTFKLWVSSTVQHLRELIPTKTGNAKSNKPEKQLYEQLYEHPLIYNLFSGKYTKKESRIGGFIRGGNLPSYISSKNFALALMDLAARGPVSKGNIERITVESIRSGIASNISDPNVRRVLLTAIDTAQGDINKAQENIEKWFDSTMERVSGWYKRATQGIIFLIGFTLAVAMNVDTIAVANYLYKNEAVRAVIVAQAEKASSAKKTTEVPNSNTEKITEVPNSNTEKTTEVSNSSTTFTYRDAEKQLKGMKIPIGWPSTESEEGDSPKTFISKVFSDPTNLISPLFGWLLTAFASTLGAPFWFDMLSKVMVVRSTIKPLEKTTSANSSSPSNESTASPTNLVDDDNEIDGCCNLQVSKETSDEELPQAEGGVA